MKSVLITIGLLIIFGCSNSETSNLNYKPIGLEYKNSFYKNDKDTIQFVRIVMDSIGTRKIRGSLFFDSHYNTNQVITFNEKITASNIKKIETELLKSGFRNKFDDKKNVLFAQLQPKGKNGLALLDLRHEIEGKIGDLLFQNEIGRWIAGDLGPGGANMLFEVTDWDKSFQLITAFLNSEGLIDDCLITKRLYTADKDWNYEIVYPVDYEGIFNQM